MTTPVAGITPGRRTVPLTATWGEVPCEGSHFTRTAAGVAALGIASLGITLLSMGVAYDLAVSGSGAEPARAGAAQRTAAYGATAAEAAGAFQLLRPDLSPAFTQAGAPRQ